MGILASIWSGCNEPRPKRVESACPKPLLTSVAVHILKKLVFLNKLTYAIRLSARTHSEWMVQCYYRLLMADQHNYCNQ